MQSDSTPCQTGAAAPLGADVTSRRDHNVELADILAAISAGHIVPHYQPLVALGSGRLVGVEALARWEQPGHDFLLPADFVPLLESAHRVSELTRWMLDRACGDLAGWRRRYFLSDEFSVAVNVSATELVDHQLVTTAVETLRRHRIPSRSLCLELTETAPIADLDMARDVLGQLRKVGVRVAIDDYGSGYTNHRYLELLPFDMVKIDQSYVTELDRRPENADFITQTVAAAGGKQVVVAEGVQTQEQADALCSLGCLHGQGSGIGQPGPGDAVVAAWAPTIAGR